MPFAEAASPRKMLPPPTTIPTCTPRETTSATWPAIWAQKAGSTPYERSPRSASPDSFSRMRRYFGRGSTEVPVPPSAAISLTSSAVLAEGVAREAPDLDVLAHGRDRVGDQL